MSAPTIGLALIVKDEESSLPNLLESVTGAFDQVVLVDTGCKDRTVEIFTEWAQAQTPAISFQVGNFEWTDDFAAARNFADSLLSTDWTCWADADDVIQGAQNLRQLAADAPPELLGYVAPYDYARDQHGNCICTLQRERLVRRGAGKWIGRVHETQEISGPQTLLPPELTQWVHVKQAAAANSNKRNLRILRKWVKDEPENPRVLAYLGTEELVRSKPKRAIGYFRRYLKLKGGWDEERAQVHRKLGICLVQEGRHEEAIDTALEAVRLLPEWPDSYLTLAEAYHQLGEHAKAISWAREVLRRGQPESLLILNPLDYSFQPRLVLASSLGGLGEYDAAIEVAEEALQLVPNHPLVAAGYHSWSQERRREHTANTYVAAAQQLVQCDEQLKALKLLEETVPHFARDHARVVAARSELRQRLAPLLDPERYRENYREGGLKPEMLVPDDHVDAFCSNLPRCRFLLDGLLEQLGVSPA